MDYVTPPSFVNYKSIVDKDYCLAPSKYAKFTPSKLRYAKFDKLDKLIESSETKEKINQEKKYFYIEIGDIDVNYGGIDYNLKLGLTIPTKPIKVQKEDILISKVRTYRKGISYINRKYDNLVCTPAFLVIRKVNSDITKEYIYAVLRHNFFTEQILSLQNRGMYPRLDNTTKTEVVIPIPNDTKLIEYVSLLTRSIIEKEEEIRSKFDVINELIHKELIQNQKSTTFHYEYPKINDIESNNRMDTGLFTEEYKRILSILKNYSGGVFYIPEKGLKSGNTPIQRIIGGGDVNWVNQKDISKFGYLIGNEKILCQRTNIKKSCALIGNRTSKEGLGEYVGITLFYDFSRMGIGQHHQGIYRVEGYPEDQLKLITILLNSKYYRKLCGNISAGSKMKEMKIVDFTKLPFPKFNGKIKEKLLELYSNEVISPKNILLDTFKEIDYKITKDSGILELSYQINKINSQLHKTIDNIIKDKQTQPDFNFLN